MIIVYGIFGIPGSGKSTQGKLLQKNNSGFIHLSTGDIFRNIRKKDSDKELIARMDEWDKTRSLYPNELTATELYKYLYERISNGTYNPKKQIIILDGYPRNLAQIGLMDGRYEMKKVAFLYMPQSVGLDRIMNIRNKIEARKEDANIIEVEKSIREHEHDIFHIMDHYNRLSKGPEIKYILGTQSIEHVYVELEPFFKTKLL